MSGCFAKMPFRQPIARFCPFIELDNSLEPFEKLHWPQGHVTQANSEHDDRESELVYLLLPDETTHNFASRCIM